MGRVPLRRCRHIHRGVAALEPLEQRTLFATSLVSLVGGNGSLIIDSGGGGGTPTAYPAHIADLTNVGGTLYFSTNANRVWRSDGTVAGTREVAKFDRGVGEFADFAGTLFFAARTQDEGTELWR